MTSEKKPPQIAACDTQVLIWALPYAMRPEKKRKLSPQNVPEMRKRAKLLLRMLSEQNIVLCIPSVVIAELLCGVEATKHARILAEFENRFLSPPFDYQASALAARKNGKNGVSSFFGKKKWCQFFFRKKEPTPFFPC